MRERLSERERLSKREIERVSERAREGMNSVDSTCVELDHNEPLPSQLCITLS